MKRLASVVIALALIAPISGAIAGSESSSGTDLAFFDPASGFWTFEGGGSIFYGAPDDLPLLCDWNGDGRATVGVYRDRTGYLLLSNHNGSTVAEYEFYYGIPRDIPLCGDWNGNGQDTIAIYRTSDQTFYLRNTNEFGVGDVEFGFGFAGGIPFSGDWNGDGVDTVGVRDPKNGFMMVAEGHQGGVALEAYLGNSDQMLVIGDWDGDGVDQFGLYDPAANTIGIAESFFKPVIIQTYQLEGDGVPLSGEWDHSAGIARQPKSAEPIIQPPADSPGTEPSSPAGDTSDPGTAPAAKIVKPAVPVPGDAVRINPGSNIQDVVSGHGEGATFLLGAGVHRMQMIRPKSGQTFIGESGAVLSGARVLDGWQTDGNAWFVTGQSQEGRVHGSCESGHARCNRPEELFINDKRMLHVSSRGAVGSGKWHFDYGSDRIYIGDDPAGKRVETSVTEVAFKGQVNGVTVTGLVIEKYANPAQVGAIDTRNDPSGKTNGSNWFIANNEVRNTHGVGIKATNGSKVTGNYVHHNGQMGMGGVGDGLLIENNEIAYNNAAGYEWGWEGGGTKFANTRDLVVRDNYSHHNAGPGLWTDINNLNTLYEGNRVMHNNGMGIFHEISYDAVIRNNYVEGNGSGHSAWLWGAGIIVAASPNVEVYGNEVVNNADGIAGIQQNRGSGEHGPYEISNLYVHDNDVTMSGGNTGFVQDIGDDSYFTSRNNRFSNNQFTLDGDGRYFSWNNSSYTLAEWNGLGQS